MSFLCSSTSLFFFFFKLYKIVLVLPNIGMNPPQVYMCSPYISLTEEDKLEFSKKKKKVSVLIITAICFLK